MDGNRHNQSQNVIVKVALRRARHHVSAEQESPALSAYFIERLNKKIGTTLAVPKTLEPKGLF